MGLSDGSILVLWIVHLGSLTWSTQIRRPYQSIAHLTPKHFTWGWLVGQSHVGRPFSPFIPQTGSTSKCWLGSHNRSQCQRTQHNSMTLLSFLFFVKHKGLHYVQQHRIQYYWPHLSLLAFWIWDKAFHLFSCCWVLELLVPVISCFIWDSWHCKTTSARYCIHADSLSGLHNASSSDTNLKYQRDTKKKWKYTVNDEE